MCLTQRHSQEEQLINYFTANKTMQLRIMTPPLNINDSFQFYLGYRKQFIFQLQLSEWGT